MLRAFGLASPPLVPPCDLDMSSRVVIVTGANSGEVLILVVYSSSYACTIMYTAGRTAAVLLQCTAAVNT